MEYGQSFFQDFEIFLRAMRKEEGDIQIILQVLNSKFVTYEIPPGILEGSEIKNTLHKLLKANVSIDNITMQSRLKTNNV